MPINKKAALEQIDSALKRYEEIRTKYRTPQTTPESVVQQDSAEVGARMKAVIERLAPSGSVHNSVKMEEINSLSGTLKALRADYEAGYLQTVEEMIHGATFSDFLEMASHLLSQGYKDAAAVIAGGVLEQHLRALCVKHGVPTTFPDKAGNPQPKMINAMNTELYKPAGVYAQNFMQQVTAWAVIRNDAAHGEYAKVDAKQVEYMIAGLHHFMLTHPA